jgi:thymidylate synthase (FAD)
MSFRHKQPPKKQSPKTNSEYIRHLIQQGHESVLEHSSYSILADDISRGLSHQLVRHRVGFAYSQLSQQYHDESSATFIEPRDLDIDEGVVKEWRHAISLAKGAYKFIATALERSSYASSLSKKERSRAIKSLARTVLPSATATTLMITGNVRAWRHLLEVRGAIPGDFEMREFCVRAIDLLAAEAPDAFYDFKVNRDTFGKFVIKTS